MRRELARQSRRWVPITVAAALVFAVLATTRSDAPEVVAGPSLDDATAPGLLDAPDSGVDADPLAGSAAGGGAAGGAVVAGDSRDDVDESASTPGGPAPTTSVPGAAGAVARSGVACTGQNRQLPFSDYGPLCVPAFTGDNGGASAPGVTADTVTVTFRIADSASVAALQAAAGDALDSLGANQDDVAADIAVLVDYFNTQFELYGRQVDFEPFSGQGDVLEEFQNRGAQGAQADAARAKDLGSFVDISMVSQTQLYAEALVSNQVMAASPVYLSQGWHETRAPYTYSALWPAGESAATFQGNVVCAALNGHPAERSNDPAIAATDRKFGIIHPENPEYAVPADVLEAVLQSCGAPVGRRVAYALDVTTAGQQATNAIAQMRAAGVTTILCLCDHTVPIFLTQAADQQGYVPEWFATLPWPDPFPRLYPERQWAGALYGGGARRAFLDEEPGRIFAVASGGAAPKAPLVLDWTYAQVLLTFTGLQAAGPQLSPTSFYRGLEQVPPTANGPLGPWDFGPGPAVVKKQFQLGTWDPDATSNLDGKQGAIVDCRGGTYARFDDAPAIAGPLGCP